MSKVTSVFVLNTFTRERYSTVLKPSISKFLMTMSSAASYVTSSVLFPGITLTTGLLRRDHVPYKSFVFKYRYIISFPEGENIIDTPLSTFNPVLIA